MNCLYCQTPTDNPKFCNKSCAQSFNNKANPKRKKTKQCKLCDSLIRSSRIYCNKCWDGKPQKPYVCKQRKRKPQKYSNCLNCNHQVVNRMFCDRICRSAYGFKQRCKQVESTGIFYKDSVYSTGSSVDFVRKYIIYKHSPNCSICGLAPRWNDKPLVLTLDHINGKPNDWSLDNLRLVCPNCDRQLPTFGSKNRGNGGRPNRK